MSEHDSYTLQQRNTFRSFKDLSLDDYYDELELKEFHQAKHDTWLFFIDLDKRQAVTERGHLLGAVRVDAQMVNAAGVLVHYITVVAVNGKSYTGTYLPRNNDWKTNWCSLDMLPILDGSNIVPLIA